ncbi:MAG: sirohydrochlorin cobaltochelatase [Clostridia bacterium]|nr:sirohydrochlorin cobaltochelatase [Clostridia bacterium]
MNGKNTDTAILVVSFGTSYNDTREKTIGAIEKKISEKFPKYELRRAFTSGVIINKLKSRDGIEIDSVDKALKRLLNDGFERVVIQPTHIINGTEYDGLVKDTLTYKGKFKSIAVGKPLLTTSDDFDRSISVIVQETESIADRERAFVFMGHGTEHYADAVYAALDYRFKARGYKNVFVGTVEGYPDTEQVLKYVLECGYKNALLQPFMIAAGDHANNDMAGNGAESWKNIFEKAGISTQCVIKGLGEYAGIQDMFADHTAESFKEL